MSNSSLISYTRLSPNKTSPRDHEIDTITIHHMAGNTTIENLGSLFASSKRGAASNYGIGSDGRIALYVNESDRSWCSANRSNDHRAITIEVANDGGANSGWPVSNAAYESLIKLCVDICQRNNIKELKWKNDKNLIGNVAEQNMTIHQWFASTACPGPYLLNHMTDIANRVNNILIPKVEPVVNHNKTMVNGADPAAKFNVRLAGEYTVKSDVNLRIGAGLGKKILTEIPKGSKVKCFGYYTLVGTSKWMLIVYETNDAIYTGFSSGNFLTK